MIYQAGSADSAKSHLVWFDRSGKALADYDPQEATITNRARCWACGMCVSRRITSESHLPAGPAFGRSTSSARPRRASPSTSRWFRNPRGRRTAKRFSFSAQVTTGGGNVEIRSKAADGSGSEKNVIRRTEQLSLPGLVARWKISNLPLGRRRENGFALDTADERRRQGGCKAGRGVVHNEKTLVCGGPRVHANSFSS